ncbi:MAG TPA: gas vesicle protein GvpG [Streptosporangiaceae bacterium]|nr:gas vesicle protein GvpG [Streptosporangiaceae bacterium]
MNLLTLPFRLPLLPVQGLMKLAEIIQDEAEQEYYNPAAVRHELEEAEWEAATGQISEEDVAQQEEQAVGRLIQPGTPAGEAAAAPGEEG